MLSRTRSRGRHALAILKAGVTLVTLVGLVIGLLGVEELRLLVTSLSVTSAPSGEVLCESRQIPECGCSFLSHIDWRQQANPHESCYSKACVEKERWYL